MSERPRVTSRAAPGKVALSETKPIRTIGDVVLEEVRELKTLLAPVRDEGPDSFLVALTKIGVLQDLSTTQQRQLSALVTEFSAQGHRVKWLARQQRQRRAWAKEGPRRLQNLKNKMAKARTAIQAVRNYLENVEVITGSTVNDALDRAVAILDSAALQEAAAVVSSLETTEPSEDAILALYDFLASECGLKKNEAQVRVGKIGNSYWDWNVALAERYSGRGESWKGCAAVRKAVARRKRTTDRPRTTH